MQLQVMTHSRRAAFCRCPRYEFLRYECGVVRTYDDQKLRIGSGVHAALDKWRRGEPWEQVIAESCSDYDYQTVLCLMSGYIAKWGPSEVVASELPFQRGYGVRGWRHAGKIDALVLIDGCVWLLETKTTDDDVSPVSEYWNRTLRDAQTTLYVAAMRDAGYDVVGVLYDAISKPGIKPRLATPIENRKYKADGTLYANQREQDESPADYGARVLADILENPDAYYGRRNVPIFDGDIRRAESDFMAVTLAKQHTKRIGVYRNTAACNVPWRCEYGSEICDGPGIPTILPDGWTFQQNRHPELGEFLDTANKPAAAKRARRAAARPNAATSDERSGNDSAVVVAQDQPWRGC